jgi:hypothetical protein
MSHPPHFTWFHLPNNIWGWVNIMKLVSSACNFFRSPVTSTLFGPNIILSNPFLKHTQSMLFP